MKKEKETMKKEKETKRNNRRIGDRCVQMDVMYLLTVLVYLHVVVIGSLQSISLYDLWL